MMTYTIEGRDDEGRRVAEVAGKHDHRTLRDAKAMVAEARWQTGLTGRVDVVRADWTRWTV